MAYQYVDGTGLWINENGEISLTGPQGNSLPQQQGPGYQIVTPVDGKWVVSHKGLAGADQYAMFPDGRVERLYEASSGAHGAAPERILESELAKYQGQSYANSADPFSSSFVSPVSYAPAKQRQEHSSWWEDTAPALWMGAFGGAAASAAMGGGAGAAAGGTAAGGAGGSAAGAGGVSAAEAAAASAGTGAAAGGAGGATLGGSTAIGSGLGAAGTAGAATAGLDGQTAGTGATAAGTSGGAATGAASTGLSSLMSNPQVLGALGGAALSSMGGSKQAGTVTTNEGLPDWLIPYAKPALDKYSTEVMNYQTDPYGIMPSAMQEFLKTIQGQYLDPSTNKWLPEYFKLGAERVKGALSPTFGHMQAFGQHSGYNEALSRGLGDLAVGLYGGAYEKERDRQNQMVGGAPNFLTQGTLSNFAPYGSYLSSLSGLGSKKEQPYFDDPWSKMLGGAMVGSQVGKAFYS